MLVSLLVPSGESGEEDEGEEGENDGDDEQIRENDGILEGSGYPHKVERVLVDRHVVDKGSGVVRANETTTITVDANAKVADTNTELGVADDVCNGSRDTRVDLLGCVGGSELFVPHGDEEDAGDEGRCG